MTSITQSLAERLSEIEDEALVAVAIIANVEPKVARRAAAGEPVKAADALCLMAALGRDPMTLEIIPARRLGKFDHNTLALFLKVHIRIKKYTVRKVAAESDLNVRVVQCILEGQHVNISNIVKACAYLDLHPFDQCERVREAA